MFCPTEIYEQGTSEGFKNTGSGQTGLANLKISWSTNKLTMINQVIVIWFIITTQPQL